jgi:hypothetical protein
MHSSEIGWPTVADVICVSHIKDAVTGGASRGTGSMTGESRKGDARAGRKPGKVSGENAPATSPARDAPFEVDLEDDGDFATPKPRFDEDELKEQEDRQP